MRFRPASPSSAAALAGLGVLAVLLAGCAGTPSSGAAGAEGASASMPTPSASVRPAPAPDAPITLPLDSYTFSADENAVIDKAEKLLVVKCMQDRGFSYRADPTDQPHRLVRVMPYGVTDPAVARRMGYHDPRNLQKHFLAGKDPRPRAYLLALQGWAGSPPTDPNAVTDGCIDRADRRLRPAQGRQNAEILGQLGDEASSRTQSDGRVVGVIARWSDCMKARGFSYQSPMQPIAHRWPDTPGAREIATATADVACKQRTNLVGVWIAVESAYQRALIERHATQLQQERQYLDTMVRNAEAVVAQE